VFDQEIVASQVKADKFPFPHEGNVTLAVRNANYELGPVILHLEMAPGSVIPAHRHDGIAEVLYVMEGDFINEGKQHLPGTSLHVMKGKVHGPHGTEKGCKVLVMWTDNAAGHKSDLSDFKVVNAAGV
jgi:quercetin dioxygenase-like cupin family protein